MISMHCPSCGAEGRVPEDKVNVRLLCKRCLKSFHLTTDGRIVAGSPPVDHATARRDPDERKLDAVDHEIDVVVSRLKTLGPRLAVVAALAAAALLGWRLMRGGETATLDEQAVRVARALVKNDVAEIRSLAVDGTGDEAAELSEALRPEFRDHAEILAKASPSVEVVRGPQSPGPGLSEVVATVRPDRPVGRMGEAALDVSASMKVGGSVDIPMVLAGDDRRGWRLDGGRTLEAYRKSRAPTPTPMPLGRTSKAAASSTKAEAPAAKSPPPADAAAPAPEGGDGDADPGA